MRRLPPVGTRVAVGPHGVDRYPCFLLRSGLTGVLEKTMVTPRFGDAEAWVKMDGPFEGGEEWENGVQIWGEDIEAVTDWFWGEWVVLDLPWWRKVLLRWT